MNIILINTNDVFDEPTLSNPFSNVLVNDYELNPEKKNSTTNKLWRCKEINISWIQRNVTTLITLIPNKTKKTTNR